MLCLRESRTEQTGVAFSSVLELCSELLCPEGERAAPLLELKNKIPVRRTVRRWKIKLDWISMLWDRAGLPEEPILFGTWGTDSSEQIGHNYLITRLPIFLLQMNFN